MPDNKKPFDIFSIKVGDSIKGDSIKQYTVDSKYDKDLLPGLNQEQVRARNQGIGSELFNGISRAAIKVVPNVISNIAAITDIEDYYNQDAEVGNELSRIVQEVINPAIDDALPIHRSSNESLDLGSTDWWTTNMTSVLGSGLEFAVTGFGVAGAVGKGLQLVKAGQQVGRAISVGTNALALNQAEAIISAQEVYKNAYELNKKKGSSDEEAKQIAADAAAYTININRLNIPLNITSAKLFTKMPKNTRKMLEEASRKATLNKLLGEGIQEYGEETVNYVGEQEGNRRGAGKEYSVGNTIKDIFSEEGIEAGVLGFLGGVVQTGFTEAGNELNGKSAEERNRYQAQQNSLREIEELRISAGTKQTPLAKILENTHVQSELINQIYKAEVDNNDGLAQQKKNQLLQYQALSAFENGTTEQLLDVFKGIVNDPKKSDPNTAVKAQEAIRKIEQWEAIYEARVQNLGKENAHRIAPLFNNQVEKIDLVERASTLFQKKTALESTIAQNTTLNIPSPQEQEELAKLLAERVELDKQIEANIADNAYIKSPDFDAVEYKKKRTAHLIGQKEVVPTPEVKKEVKSEVKAETPKETKAPEVKESKIETSTKPVSKEELEDKRFTKSDDKYQYVYRINNGKVSLVGVKDSKGKAISKDAERDAAAKVGESFIPELSKYSPEQFKDLTEGKEPRKIEEKKAEVKAEKKEEPKKEPIIGKVFTRKDALTTAKETTTLSKKGDEVFSPEAVGNQIPIGSKVTFFNEKERKGTWDGKFVREDKTDNPFGLIPILNKPDGWIRIDSLPNSESKKEDNSEQVSFDDLFGKQETFEEATKKSAEKAKKKTVDNKVEIPISDEGEKQVLEPQSQGGFTLLKTSATDTETREKEKNEDRIRWNNFVDNYKGNVADLLFEVVTKGHPLYDSLLAPENKDYEKKSGESGVFLVLTDSKGNYIKEGEHYLWTSPVKKIENTKGLALAPDHYSRVHGLEYKKGDENKKDSEFRKHFDANEVPKHESWRNELLSGKHKYVRPLYKSPGALMYTAWEVEDNWLSPAQTLFSDINNPAKDGVELFIPTQAEVNIDEQGNTVVENYYSYPYIPEGSTQTAFKKLFVGSLYAKKGDTFIKLRSRTLNNKEVFTLISLFEKLSDEKQIGNLIDVIKNYVQVTPNEKDLGKYNLYFKDGLIHFGDKTIKPEEVRSSDEFKQFLYSRRRQVDKNKLADGGIPSIPTVSEKGYIDYNKKITYNEFLFGENPAFTINIPAIGGEIKQHENAYFAFGNEFVDDLIKEETEEESPFAPTVDEALDKAVEESKPTVKRRKKKEGGFDRLAQKKNYVREDLAKVEAWYKSRFNDGNFRITKELIDNQAWGQFYAGIVYLYEQAEEGTLYHEAYHKVEEEYLTEDQVQNLHDEMEKALGKKMSVLEGKEYRAEDFRNYVLTGQTALAKRPIRNTLFRRLYNYIKQLVTGHVTIEQVYKKLASEEGYSKSKKVRVSYEKLSREKLLGMKAKESKEILDSMTYTMFNILFQNNITPETLTSDPIALSNNVKKAYITIENNFIERSEELADKIEAGTATPQEVTAYNKLDTILDNFDEIKKAHKEAIRPLIKITEDTEEAKKLDEKVADNNEDLINSEDSSEESQEDIDSNEDVRGGGEHGNANEVNPITTMSNNTKMLLATLPEIDEKGNEIKNSLGLSSVSTEGFGKIYNTLVVNLNGQVTQANIWNKLDSMKKDYPYVKALMDKLGNPSLIPNLGKITNSKGEIVEHPKFKLWTDFHKDMSKYNSKGTVVIYNSETGDIYQRDANSAALRERFKDKWKSNLLTSGNTLDSNGKTIVDKKKVFAYNGLEFLDAIGIDLEAYEDKTAHPDERKSVYDAIKGIRTFLAETTEASSVFDEKANNRLNDLLDVAVKYSKTVVEPSYFSADNKSKYGVTNHNYLTIMTSEINNARTLDELYERNPWLATVNSEGSIRIASLFDSNGNKRIVDGNPVTISIPTYAGFNEQGETGKATTKLEVADKIVEDLNNLLTAGTIALPRVSDKATENGVSMSSYILSDGKASMLPVPIEEVKNSFDSKEVRHIFEGYFKAELNRIRSRRLDKLGSDIEIYGINKLDKDGKEIEHSSNAANWTIFQDILSDETKSALEPYMNSREDVTPEILDSVYTDVQEYLTGITFFSDSLSIKSLFNEYGIGSQLAEEKEDIYENGKKTGESRVVRASGLLGISNRLTKKDGKPLHNLETIMRAFAVNQLVSAIEDHKLFFGDKAFHKDPFKRYSAFAGTKKFALAEKNYIDYINKNQQWGEYELKDTLRTIVIADVKAKSKYVDKWIQDMVSTARTKEDLEKVYDAYYKMDEADAQGLGNLVFYKHFKELASEWTEKEDKQYNYEMAYEIIRLYAKNPEVYGKKYSKEVLFEAHATVAKGNPGYPLMPIKAQYAGPQVYKGLYAHTFHKYSIAPMFYRLVEGTNLEEKYLSMVDNHVGYMVFGSGVKLGARVNQNNELPSFYTKDGNTRLVDDETPIQNINYRFLGIQVDIAPKVKEKVIFGSQFRKLFMANSFNGGVPFDFTGTQEEWESMNDTERLGASPTYAIHKEFLGIIDSMVQENWDKLVKELGFQEDANGNFTQLDVSKLVDLLKTESEDRQLAKNLIDSLSWKEIDGKKVLEYSIDSLVNRPKLEAMLFSLVNSRVIKQTMPGDGMVQRAISGSESKSLRTIDADSKKYLSDDLEFYRKDENGKVLPMQVKVPLTAQFKDLLKKYGTMEALNDAIKNDSKFDKKLLTMVGYRIPTQGLNSIEFMEIVEFIPDAAGNTIILPTEIVAKSGGDFDIDKLNVFRPNFSSTDRMEFLNKELTRINKATGGNLPLVKSEEEIDELLENEEENQMIRDIVERNPSAEVTYMNSKGKSIKAKQNRIIELAKMMLENPINFEQLTTPNTTALLKDGDTEGLVNEIRQAKGIKTAKKSFTRELTFGHILEQFKYFLGGKAGVGVAAVHNTFHTLFQEANTKIESTRAQINFDVNRDIQGNVVLGGKLDKADRLISDIISQFINAYVDVAKDPFYKDLNAGLDAANVYFFLIHTGADMRTISYFMNQPAILELLNAEAKNNSITSKIKGVKKKKDIADTILKKYNDKVSPELRASRETLVLGTDINERLLGYMAGGNTEEYYADQVQFLEDFLRYRKYGDDLTEFTRTLNQDTAKVNSFAQGDKVQEATSRIESGESIFTPEERRKIQESTIVGSFDKIGKTQRMFSPMFITQSPEVKETRNRIIKLINPFSAKDKESLYKMVDNDFISYLVQRFYKDGDRILGERVAELSRGDNSVAKQLAEVKKVVKDNVLIDQLQSLITPEVNDKDNISIYSRRLTTPESNDLTQAFRELLEYPDSKVQKFANELIKFGIVQSGLANSPITYVGLIPYDKYGDIVNQAIAGYAREVDILTGGGKSVDTIMDDFIARFFLKNIGNPIVAPYKSKKTQKKIATFTRNKSNGSYTAHFRVQVGDETKSVPHFQLLGMESIGLDVNKHKLQDFYLHQTSKYLNINFSGEDIDPSEGGDDSPNTPSPITDSPFASPDVESQVKKNLDRGISVESMIVNGLHTGLGITPEELSSVVEKLSTKQDNMNKSKVEIWKGFWNRNQVASQTDKVFLFGDNTNDRTVTKYVPSATQAVIRGLSNAIGIDTKKDRGTNSTSYLSDSDFEWFKKHVDEQIELAKSSGKTIVIPADGIGTGKAMLDSKAPKLAAYLNQKLEDLTKETDSKLVSDQEVEEFIKKCEE